MYNGASKINCDNIFPHSNATLSYLLIIYCIFMTVLCLFIIFIMIFFNNIWIWMILLTLNLLFEPQYFAKVNYQIYVIEQLSWKR